MTPYVDVSFHGQPGDLAIEDAIHRWVARLEAMRIEVQRAKITLEPCGRRRTRVSVTVSLVNGHTQTTATIHADPYVAVADAFRAMKQQLQPVVVAPRARALAFA